MQVTLKLYATLMRYLPPGTQRHAVQLEVENKATVQQVIERFNISDEMAFLVMLNGVYLQPEERKTQLLKAQDTLAIWPKVAGG
jgi:molybdopterin converting factor small subunit